VSLQIFNRFKSVGSAKVALVNFILRQDESKDLIFEFDIQEQALISDLVLEKAVDLVIELVEDLSELSHELLFPVFGSLLLEDVSMVELLQEGLHRSDHLKILVVGEVHVGLRGLREPNSWLQIMHRELEGKLASLEDPSSSESSASQAASLFALAIDFGEASILASSLFLLPCSRLILLKRS